MNFIVKAAAATGGGAFAEFLSVRYLDALSLSNQSNIIYYFLGRYAVLVAATAIGLTLLIQGLTSKPMPPREGIVKVKTIADIKGLIELARLGDFEVSSSDLFSLLDVMKLKVRGFGKFVVLKYVDPPTPEAKT